MFLTQHHKYQENIFHSSVRLIRRYMLKGDRHRCNVCESNFSRFLSYGFNKRENVLCPGCGSIESTRVIWFYLKNEVFGQKNKKKFLIVAPEKALLRKLEKYDLDLDKCQHKYFNPLSNYKSSTLQRGVYDVIIFSHVIQYLKDDVLALQELRRLLRPGGFVLIQTGINPDMDRTYEHINTSEDSDRLKEYYEKGAQRVYGVNFIKHLRRIEFEVELIDYADQLGDIAKEYYCLGDGTREKIFKCKKI